MARAIIAVLFSLFPLCAHAQSLASAALNSEKIAAPNPKPDRRIFWTGTALLAAAKSADAVTTRRVLDAGAAENNPLFGAHPSVARQVGVNAGYFAAQAVIFYFTERSHRSWIRWTGRVALGGAIVNHAQLAACNAGIVVRNSPVDYNCRSAWPY